MPEKLKALANEIILEISMLESKGQLELMSGDYMAYEETKIILFKVAELLRIDTAKYSF